MAGQTRIDMDKGRADAERFDLGSVFSSAQSRSIKEKTIEQVVID